MTKSGTMSAGGHAHYRVLDGFRGLAILMVVVFHASHVTTNSSYFMRVASHIGGFGWAGVDVFFVLSGFLITGILFDSVGRPRYFRNFYIRRALRIFPLFYGVLLLLVLLTPFLHLEWHWGHLAYLFYCQNIAMNIDDNLGIVKPGIFLGHFWSLAVEEQYYLVWPFVIWAMRDSRKIMRLCVAGVVGILAMRFILLAIALRYHVNIQNWNYRGFPMHADGLLLGSWLALAIRRRSVPEVIRSTRWLFWLGVAGLAAGVAVSRSVDFGTNLMTTVGFTLIAAAAGGLLLRSLVPGTLAMHFFELPFLRFFGKYSYGLYVYHLLFHPMMPPMKRWLDAHLHAAGSVAYLAIWLGGTVGISVLSYHIFESPFLRLKDRFAPAQPSVPEETPLPAEAGLQVEAAEV
jgi:peptidoglycan/LPS O-acetylase OafA/YrhL